VLAGKVEGVEGVEGTRSLCEKGGGVAMLRVLYARAVQGGLSARAQERRNKVQTWRVQRTQIRAEKERASKPAMGARRPC